MMFLNFFGAIPLLLPNIVWNAISIIFLIRGKEYGFQFAMGWDHSLNSNNVHQNGTLDENNPNEYLMMEQSTCSVV